MAPSRAFKTVLYLTSFLFPSNKNVSLISTPSLSFQAMHTVPTGLSEDPPPGPAIPLIATPRSRAKSHC